MSALEPQGTSQPSLGQAYETPGNPVDKEPAEQAATDKQAKENNGQAVAERIPERQSAGTEDATPSSLGRGIHGAPPGEEAHGETHESVGRNNELDGEQMRASGEGDVADVVEKKPGAIGAQEDLASDLDRKKAEQAPKREAIQKQRKENVDVAGILGQRGGPASTVN